MNKKQFNNIIERMHKLPESTDLISAYGCSEEIGDSEVLDDFYEQLGIDGFKQEPTDDIINAFVQLYCWDYDNYSSELYAFYGNLYGYNSKENVLRACEWFITNDAIEIGSNMKKGYEEIFQDVVSDWMFSHMNLIYQQYRKIMFLFEEKYLK